MRLAILLCCAILAWGEESAAITAFNKAMAGDDALAKREAINALVSKDAGSDDVILPILVSAVGDRQANDPAINALRARTGLTPPLGANTNGRMPSAYPGYPASDTRAGWNTWLAARTKDMETKKQLDKIEKDIEKVADQTKPAEAKPEETAEPVAPPPRIPTDDLGKLDRLVYKSGRTLIAFVRSKRLDGDGNLVSVRVVHKDGAGEEVVDASVISRIEEDVE